MQTIANNFVFFLKEQNRLRINEKMLNCDKMQKGNRLLILCLITTDFVDVVTKK